MATLPLLLVFFGGLALLFLTGRLIGHIIGLDKYFSDNKSPKTSVSVKSQRKKRKGKKVNNDTASGESGDSPIDVLSTGNEYARSDQIIRFS